MRGHMPDYPLLPGVLMCEAAAQLCSYYVVTHRAAGRRLHRLRRPGERAFSRPGPARRPAGAGRQGVTLHRRQTIFNVQGFVGSTMVFHADVHRRADASRRTQARRRGA